MTAFPRSILFAGVVTLAGCADLMAPDPAGIEVQSSLVATGDETIHLDGITIVLPIRKADYRELNPGTGVMVSWDVTPLLITSLRSAGPTKANLSVRVLGELTPGSYGVRRILSPVGAGREFSAELIVPDGDGWDRHYLVDEGVLEVVSVRPFLVGSMSLRASKVVRLPSSPRPGVMAVAVPAKLAVTASMGGAAPGGRRW